MWILPSWPPGWMYCCRGDEAQAMEQQQHWPALQGDSQPSSSAVLVGTSLASGGMSLPVPGWPPEIGQTTTDTHQQLFAAAQEWFQLLGTDSHSLPWLGYGEWVIPGFCCTTKDIQGSDHSVHRALWGCAWVYNSIASTSTTAAICGYLQSNTSASDSSLRLVLSLICHLTSALKMLWKAKLWQKYWSLIFKKGNRKNAC